MEINRLGKFYKDSLEYLLSVGYDRVGVETFQEMLVELFEADLPNMKSKQAVFNLFSNKAESEHIVWYSRILCAAYMKKNADRFLPFLPGDWHSIDDYCSAEVEPQNKECEEPQIIALAEVLKVGVSIEYVSASSSNMQGSPCKFGPEDAKVVVKFIYRPGHYDVLYD